MPRFEREPSEYMEKLVALNRVSKTVKGGRVMKFSALMVVGDGKGTVGYGLGKAAEVPEAIRKGLEAAKKNMVTVTLSGTTIPHETIGEFGAGRVLMKPACWSLEVHVLGFPADVNTIFSASFSISGKLFTAGGLVQ